MVLTQTLMEQYVISLQIEGQSFEYLAKDNGKYHELFYNGNKIGRFNGKHKVTSYSFIEDCYTTREWKKLRQLCPWGRGRDKESEWHSSDNGGNCLGRKVQRNGYTYQMDMNWIKSCIRTYKDTLERGVI